MSVRELGENMGVSVREVQTVMNASRPTRIGYVCKMFPRFSETFIVNEILTLEALGFDVTIYSLKTPPAGPRHDTVRRLRARVVYLPESVLRGFFAVAAAHVRVFFRGPLVWLRTALYILSRGNLHAVKRFLQAGVLAQFLVEEPVDQLHAHFASSATRVSMLVHRLAGIPYSFTAHAKDIYIHSIDTDLLRDKIREAAFVSTVSEFNRKHLLALADPGTRHIHRIYNGVDLARFDYAADGREPGLVVGVGRLIEKKGFSDLLEALAPLAEFRPSVRLVLIGEGPLRDALEAQARRLGIEGRVTFPGSLPQLEVRDWLRRAEVFALPCRVGADGNRDGLPTVLLEAEASGVPVVTTDVTGNPEIVADGKEGFLVPERRPDLLTARIGQLLGDPELRARMGRRARERAERQFDLSRNVAELARLFRSAPSTASDAPANLAPREDAAVKPASGLHRLAHDLERSEAAESAAAAITKGRR